MGKSLKGKELGKGLSQRKDGKYQANYIDRYGRRKYIYSRNLKELKNLLAEAQAKEMLSVELIDRNTKLDEWYEIWMEVYKEPYVRPNSIRQYKDIYRTKIQPRLGEFCISEIRKTQIQKLLNDLAKEGYQWETLNKVRIILGDMFSRAMEDRKITFNPIKGVRNPCGKKRPEKDCKALSIEDQKAFFEIAKGTWYYNAYVVAICTGLRPGELFGLREKDIDFNKKEVHVQRTLLYQELPGDKGKEFHIDPPKTETSDRIIPLTDEALKAILEQIKNGDIIKRKKKSAHQKTLERKEKFDDLIFTTSSGTPICPQIFNDAIRKLVLEINLMRDDIDEMEIFTGHWFRHTFATRCFEADVPPKTVQVLLGHATLDMTMNLYVSVLRNKKQQDMDKFHEAMEGLLGIMEKEPSDVNKIKGLKIMV